MNAELSPPSAPAPRLTCRWVRWRAAVAASESPGAPRNPRHVARCPDCAAYFSAQQSLVEALRFSARASNRPAPARLAEQIIAALDQPPRVAPAPASLATRGWSWGLAGGIAAAALATFILLRPPAPRTGVPGEVRPAATPPLTLAVVATIPETLRSAIPVDPTTPLTADPLQAEVDAVYADARAALRFLALNFSPGLPSETDPTHRS